MMTLHIARREFLQSLRSPFVYFVAAGLLFIAGIFFSFATFSYADYSSQSAMYGEPISVNEGLIQPFVSVMGLLLVLFMPIASMRVFSDELRGGVMPLLLSSPISSAQIVIGKWLGLMGFWLVLLLFGLSYVPATVLLFSSPAIAPMVSGLLGLLLLCSLGSALGVFTSALTGSPIVSAVASWGALMLLWTLAWAAELDGPLGTLGEALGLTSHLDPFVEGLITTPNLGYFLLWTTGLLIAAQQLVESRRWR